MRIVRVDHPDDPRLHEFLRLKDVQLRTARETAEGFFLAEGEQTIRRAIAAGYEPRAFLGTRPRIEAFADVDALGYVVDEGVLASTTGFLVHRGALASFSRKPLPEPGDLLATARRVVVMEDLVDHTNVGAIFRSAAALGWEAVLLTPRSADPLYRRAVRTSMGAVFTLGWTRIDHRKGIDVLHAAGFVVAAATPEPDATVLEGVEPPERLAVVFGSEGPGLSRRWREGVDVRTRIRTTGPVNELNVGAAAAIVLYHFGPGHDR
jgi:tRNA G18 (ribose-2'-O)-methylase SpoU